MARIGDMVRIVEGESPYYKVGARARVTKIDSDGCWMQFRDMGNEAGSFDDGVDGEWYATNHRFVVELEEQSLRDEFAMAALPALLSAPRISHLNILDSAKYIAETAYHLADAMLVAREGK
jgi:hypothetical protein